MKFIKLLLVIMAAAMIALALGGNALAFHDGGVAYCAGCHTMHNSQDGSPIASAQYGGHLLLQQDSSSTCLRCHADYGQLSGMGGENSPLPGTGYGSGGDFYWLKRTFTWSAHGHESSSTGDSHGHNIVAGDFGLPMGDQTPGMGTAPGGSYNGDLSCASCHDPHGNTNFRMLRDAPYDGANFRTVPVAQGTSRRTIAGTTGAVTDSNHTAFLKDMSEWCAGCHTTFINGVGARMHPADHAMSTDYVNQYNQYVSSANPEGGSQATAYNELVPFQLGASKSESDLNTQSTEGPLGSGEVMCLSCHRAHASAFQDAGRWDFTTEFLYDSHPAGSGDGSTPEERLHSYYGRTWTDPEVDELSQRSLCNKCHGKDGPHGTGEG